jgi:hypothetical protein
MLKIDKDSDREAFQKRMQDDPRRAFLAHRVWAIKSENIKYVKTFRNQNVTTLRAVPVGHRKLECWRPSPRCATD